MEPERSRLIFHGPLPRLDPPRRASAWP